MQTGAPLPQAFTCDGFVVLRGLIGADEIGRHVSRLERLAGSKRPWTLPDGVHRHPEFWPLLFDPRLLAAVRAVLGRDIRYLPHNDLHVGFSSFSWHRDNVNREGGVGPDWVDEPEPYALVRVGVYLQRFADSGFRLGLIPGSHRHDPGAPPRHYRGMGTVAKVVSGFTGLDLTGADARWVATEPGDCVIFDPRILHTGSRCRGPKYSIFVAYGRESAHFRRHWQYYVRLRRDLGYSDIPEALADRLRAAGLLAATPPAADEAVAAAWMPSPAYTYIAKRFK
jgi:hypothetical protein